MNVLLLDREKTQLSFATYHTGSKKTRKLEVGNTYVVHIRERHALCASTSICLDFQCRFKEDVSLYILNNENFPKLIMLIFSYFSWGSNLHDFLEYGLLKLYICPRNVDNAMNLIDPGRYSPTRGGQLCFNFRRIEVTGRMRKAQDPHR